MRCITAVIVTFLCLTCHSCVVDETADPVTISGFVKDSSGNSISGVNIKIESLPANVNTETSSSGYYLLEIPSGGTALLTISKDGYATQSETISFKGGERIVKNVKLLPED